MNNFSLKFNRNIKGQSTASEYVLIFFIVMSIISVMTVYVRRLLQARTVDALNYMADTVQADYPNKFRYQYEPYYTNAASRKLVDAVDVQQELQGINGTGIIDTQYNDWSKALSASEQAPPAKGD